MGLLKLSICCLEVILMDALSACGASVEVYMRGKVRLECEADLACPFDYESIHIFIPCYLDTDGKPLSQLFDHCVG